MKARFDFYEIVLLKDSSFTKSKGVMGLTGLVLGKSKNENDVWGYAIYLFELEEVWDLDEDFLESTGHFSSKEEFYDGNSVQVKVKNGKGETDD